LPLPHERAAATGRAIAIAPPERAALRDDLRDAVVEEHDLDRLMDLIAKHLRELMARDRVDAQA
jgi:hypothetical protein